MSSQMSVTFPSTKFYGNVFSSLQSSTFYFLPTVHSQWASRKVRTCPCASWAPISRALTKPTRSWVRRTRVGTGSLATYSSRGSRRNAATFISPLRTVKMLFTIKNSGTCCSLPRSAQSSRPTCLIDYNLLDNYFHISYCPNYMLSLNFFNSNRNSFVDSPHLHYTLYIPTIV